MGHLKLLPLKDCLLSLLPEEHNEISSKNKCPVCKKQVWEPFTYDCNDIEWFNIAKENPPALIDIDGEFGKALHKINEFHYFDYCINCGTCVS
jgi:hypothetical protein